MKSSLRWCSIVLLSFMSLFEFETLPASAQGRTYGNTRDGGSKNGEGVSLDSAPVLDESRHIGRTRPTDPVITPASKAPTEVYRADPQEPIPSAEHAPMPPPSLRPTPRPHVPRDRHPQVIGEGGGNCGGGLIVETIDPPEGLWIREGISFGKDVTLADSHLMPDYSGFDFSETLKRPFDHPLADMFVEQEDGELMMMVWEDTEIMDIGLVGVPSVAIYVPRMDWSPTHSVRLFIGHEYVVRTWDHHYARFYVAVLLDDRVSFDWAYQHAKDTDWNGPVAVMRDFTQGKFGH